jgi:rubrerythrin
VSATTVTVDDDQLHELLYQALETERGGIAIYEMALRCALDEGLQKEWNDYLDQTRHHEEVVIALFAELGLDSSVETPGRAVVRHIGESLVTAMKVALSSGPPEAAQLVAGESVVLAETKDHLNWELLRVVADKSSGPTAKALAAACDEVEGDEDEHLYHSTGWTRELWLESLGLPAALPPPEERKDVKTAIGAARAKNARDDMATAR